MKTFLIIIAALAGATVAGGLVLGVFRLWAKIAHADRIRRTYR